jgi:hypothetical protein
MLTIEVKGSMLARFKISACLDCADMSEGLSVTFSVYETVSSVFGV